MHIYSPGRTARARERRVSSRARPRGSLRTAAGEAPDEKKKEQRGVEGVAVRG